jgi:predicted SAM-dependent methyltransferase
VSNFINGFPFEDNSFQVAYSSHVLEHFTLEQGEFLIKEAYRILKNKGILRIVVPDFESTIRE